MQLFKGVGVLLSDNYPTWADDVSRIFDLPLEEVALGRLQRYTILLEETQYVFQVVHVLLI